MLSAQGQTMVNNVILTAPDFDVTTRAFALWCTSMCSKLDVCKAWDKRCLVDREGVLGIYTPSRYSVLSS